MRLTVKCDEEYFSNVVPNEHHNSIKPCVQKLGQLEDIGEELGIDLVLFCNVMKNQVIYVKGKEPEWADNGTKKDIVKYCVVRFTVEELVVRFNEYCSNHVISKPLYSYGKTWALTKEELK